MAENEQQSAPEEKPAEEAPKITRRLAAKPGPAPVQPGLHLDGPRQQILGAIAARKVTDKDISAIWVFAPMLISIAGVIIGIAVMISELFRVLNDIVIGVMPASLLGAFALGFMIVIASLIVALIFFGLLTFNLVERQNQHFQREAQLRTGVVYYLRAAAGSAEKEATIAVEIATINSLHVQSMQDERPHSAIGWALALVLGSWVPVLNIILLLYLFNFLMKNLDSHDIRWSMFLQQTGSALMKLGHNTAPQVWYSKRLEQRSFILYVVLSIITLGLFAFYWWYILITDPNEHFRMQAYHEDRLAETITRI